MSKKKLFPASLNRQLLTLIGFIVIVLISTNLFYLIIFNSITEKRSEAHFSTIFQLVDARVNAVVNNIEMVTQSLFHNKTMQIYLTDTGEDPPTEPFVKNLLMETILFSSKFGDVGDQVFDAIYLKKNNHVISAEKQELEHLFWQICRDYMLDTKVYYSSLYTQIYRNDSDNTNYYAIIQPLSMTINAHSDATPLGYCVYVCNASQIQDQIFFTEMPDSAELYLYDYDNNIVAASDNKIIGGFLPGLLDIDVSLSSLSYAMQPINSQGEKYLSKMTKIDGTDWSLLLLIPYSKLTTEINQMYMVSIVFGTISLVLIAIFAAAIMGSNIKQVRSIINGLRHVGSVGVQHRLEHCSIQEFDTIATSSNIMLEQLEKTTRESMQAKERLFANEILKKNADMYALQSQIKPHFLYNTLECIRSIAQYYEVQEITHITSSMASIFRYCTQDDEFVPLSEEMKCVREYLNIMEIRFPKNMHVTIDVPESCLNLKILRMILQPIVENAINHGLRKVFRRGEFSITARLENEKLILIVQDNGAGIADDEYEPLCKMLEGSDDLRDGYRGKRIGMANINARLKLTHGDEYGLRLKSKRGRGTSVTLEMPAMPYNESGVQTA